MRASVAALRRVLRAQCREQRLETAEQRIEIECGLGPGQWDPAAGLQLLAINWKKRRQERAVGEGAAPDDFVRSQVQDPKSFADTELDRSMSSGREPGL